MNSIEALKHALETLEEVQMAITTSQWMNRRIEALRAAIEQAEKQEPLITPADVEQLARIEKLVEDVDPYEKQEPVAWFTEDHREDKSATTYSKKMSERWKEKGWPVTPLYTAPPQREWQGLTDEDIYSIIESNVPPKLTSLFEMAEWVAKVVEARLKEKNT